MTGVLALRRPVMLPSLLTSSGAASQKKIVILGGSYGGVSTGHYPLKHVVPHLPDKASYQAIVISASSQAMCRPACPRALISDDMFPQEKLFVNIPKTFEQYPEGSFRFIHGSAAELDHTDRIVSISLAIGNTEKLDFYALVIATDLSLDVPRPRTKIFSECCRRP